MFFQMDVLFRIWPPFPAVTYGEIAATAVMAVLLAWLIVSDLRQFRIPDAASLPLILAGLACSHALAVTPLWLALIGAAAGYGVFAGVGAVFYRLTGEDGLGLGDAKLLAGCGAWLGWHALPWLVAVAALGALVFALLTGNRKVAFGPWLAAALWVFWILRITGNGAATMP